MGQAIVAEAAFADYTNENALVDDEGVFLWMRKTG